jgi:hypothetical protein
MSWNDPCSECGNPRYACECKPKTPTKEDLERIERERKRMEEGAGICKIQGHDFVYSFIVSTCTRCGETTEY